MNDRHTWCKQVMGSLTSKRWLVGRKCHWLDRTTCFVQPTRVHDVTRSWNSRSSSKCLLGSNMLTGWWVSTFVLVLISFSSITLKRSTKRKTPLWHLLILLMCYSYLIAHSLYILACLPFLLTELAFIFIFSILPAMFISYMYKCYAPICEDKSNIISLFFSNETLTRKRNNKEKKMTCKIVSLLHTSRGS